MRPGHGLPRTRPNGHRSSNNILSPANGKPIIVPTQDIILGLYYMTREKINEKGEDMIFADAKEVLRAYGAKAIALQASIDPMPVPPMLHHWKDGEFVSGYYPWPADADAERIDRSSNMAWEDLKDRMRGSMK